METIPVISPLQLARQQHRFNSELTHIWEILDQVKDPEVPAISLWDLGILQEVHLNHIAGEDRLTVVITPTYSGCPAMRELQVDIKEALNTAGYPLTDVELRLSPAWSTEFMTEQGKRDLKAYGIAPPHSKVDSKQAVNCPHCNNDNTEVISEFGSTACKSLYKCHDCLEPFDYFKCL